MCEKLLSDEFTNCVHQIGMKELKGPVFYNSPIGIRFEIGNPDVEEKSEYINGAFERTKTIYHSMPTSPDILRIDLYVDYEDNYHKNVLCELNSIGLPTPDEKKIVKHFDDEYWSDNDDGSYEVLECYWDLTKNSSYVDELLYCIIMSEHGGTPNLPSTVYFINTLDFILFWLYDDRGADLVAPNKEILLPIYRKFNNWILDYDRKRIDTTFAE